MHWGDKKGEGVNWTSRIKHKLESLGMEDIWEKKFWIRIREGMLIKSKYGS
jgi:hypothetical protein